MQAKPARHPQWAVYPFVNGWAQIGNAPPYVLTGGVSYACLNTANFAKRTLEARGVRCYVELIDA